MEILIKNYKKKYNYNNKFTIKTSKFLLKYTKTYIYIDLFFSTKLLNIIRTKFHGFFGEFPKNSFIR